MVLPISLCCRIPEVFSEDIYTILVTEGTVNFINAAPLPFVPAIAIEPKFISNALNVPTPPLAPIMPPNIPSTRPPERRESRASAARNGIYRLIFC